MKKALKIGGIVLGGLLILFFGVALFLPSEMSVTVSESIHAPPERVFDLTNDLRVFTGWISWGEDHGHGDHGVKLTPIPLRLWCFGYQHEL